MRASTPLLAALLASGQVPLAKADLYTLVTQSGSTFYWSDYSMNIPWGGNTFSGMGPFINLKKLQTVNTMAVPSLEFELVSTAASFAGGADLMSQMHNGFFDGSTVTLDRLYMVLPVTDPPDTSLGVVRYFGGVTSTIEITGAKTSFKVKGANNRLDQYAPRNLFQIGCLHNFCDPFCTLNAATFTFPFTVGSNPTRIFIPWTVPPANPTLFQLGTCTMTSGVANGQSQDIAYADMTGVYLAYPLYTAPSPGDTFNAFEGCDKTLTTCTSRSNTQNWRGFPFVPPAFQNF